ncbi:MAG: hypothetical protein AAFU85_07835 [Planctomycetota bacterium]
MNAQEALVKYGPSLAVIGTALYLGWPPAEPLDLGDSTVRAKAVRWKKGDLESPRRGELSVADPFREVLIAKPSVQKLTPVGEIVPAIPMGPTETELRAGLLVGGIGTAATTRWAIINDKVCRVGDSIPVAEVRDVRATIEAIEADHVIARVSGRTLKITRLDRRSREMLKHNKAGQIPAVETVEQERPGEEDESGDLETLILPTNEAST